jgi:hypothetical protein
MGALDTTTHADVRPDRLWTSDVPPSELAEQFAGFHPTVLSLIANGSSMVRANPVDEREPLTAWSTDHVTLLGYTASTT